MPYLLDANVFIQAKNLHYGLDFCPAFWDWLLAKNVAGEVFSIERVEDELKAGADELTTWASARGPSFFLKPDAPILNSLPTVSTWTTGQGYEPSAVSTFLQVADYYLVAHALAHGYTIVTHEKASTSTKKIKIPEPCIGLGVKCVTPFEMLRTGTGQVCSIGRCAAGETAAGKCRSQPGSRCINRTACSAVSERNCHRNEDSVEPTGSTRRTATRRCGSKVAWPAWLPP